MAAEAPTTVRRQGSSWRHQLQQAWLQRGPLAITLWPISWLYGAAWALRTLLYRLGIKRSHRLPVPVLVVGNVVVGGAGKTPTVIQIVRHLQAAGWQTGVISRGHGRSRVAVQAVMPDSDPALVGDEPTLIAQATGVPVVVGRDRVAAGLHLLKKHPEVNLIVSDDGMQHWALQRDVTVVVFDARGTGNGWLLPAGLLREPWPARSWGNGPLLVVQTGLSRLPAWPCPAHAAPRRLAPYAINAHGDQRSLGDFQASAALGALAGIAQPDAFFDMLRQLGLPVHHTLDLPDHASTTDLLAALGHHPDVITWLCTEKDAVKLFPAFASAFAHTPDVWAIPLEQTIEPAFFMALDAALPLSSRHGHQTP